MNNEILVSILLPVQGAQAADDAALDRTVQAVRAQTERRWQLYLIASAGDRHRAEHWARLDPRIRVVPHEGRGRAAALRCGLQACQGTHTVFLDTEHAWTADFLALTTAFLAVCSLEDLVCMDTVLPSGRPAVAYRQSVYREQGRLWEMLAVAVPQDARWHQGELARHLRWGEYTRLAVTLLRSECAELLVPALYEECEALEYRLQARLAATCPVNRLALTGAVHRPVAVAPELACQRERDALAVFDEVHGRQWETDPEVARLRRERLARITTRTPWRALVAHGLAWLGWPWSAAGVRPLGGTLSMDLAESRGSRMR